MPDLAAHPPVPAHSAPPWRRWVPWLLGSLLLHAAALVAMQPAPSVLRLAAPATPVAVRLSAPAVARPAVEAPPAPAAEPAPQRQAPGPQAEARTAPDAAPPQANPNPPEAFASPLPEAGSPGAELLPVPFAPSAQWPYELLFEGERGDALLDWQREGLGYVLQMERRTSRRTLPTWRSTGTVSPAGLAPSGFASRNPRGQGPRFEIDQAALTVSGPSGTLPVPRGVQDRLSWMLQLSATLAAHPQARAIELTVVDWRGRPQAWRLDWVADSTVRLSDGAERAAQHWRRQELGAAQAEIEMWLDPELGHLPLRIVHSVRGDERWELQLSPSAVPKLETLPQVRAERDQSPTPVSR